MGSVGDCYDNALCESFFATLECERLDRRTYRTREQARRDLFTFIEGWYNPHRRHSSLGQISPAAFERQHATAESAPCVSVGVRWEGDREPLTGGVVPQP